jgi:glycosyltransferase involved in cell wall biosynthesis
LDRDGFVEFVQDYPAVRFLFVNDGSTDQTLKVLTDLAARHENLQVLNLEQNSGKAEAVRQGVLYACNAFTPDYVGFWDADLATPLEELPQFIKILAEQDFDAVTGLRLVRLGAKVKRKALRHHLGRVFATAASQVLRLSVYDTQCGAKLYKAKLAACLFGEKFISRWLFDVEILARYVQRYGVCEVKKRIYEYPLFAWEDKSGSQVKVKDFVKAPLELWKIKRRYLSNRKMLINK